MYLLDVVAFSHHGDNIPPSVYLLQLFINSSLAELEYGIACSSSKEENQSALDALLNDIPVLPFDALSARAYGPVRMASRERSRDALDKLIASHAIALGVTLVTNNEADFAGYPGLVVENWVNSH